jgi:DNA-directed RNA polymerase specialized sigma24 family protein
VAEDERNNQTVAAQANGGTVAELQTAISDPDCTDCNDSDLIESAARELYQTAALFVGDETEAMKLVEETVASVEMDPCADGDAARSAATSELVHRALARVAALRAAQMHPSAAVDLGGCVETDDLSAAGITREQLDVLLAGSGRVRMRQWLEGLGPVERSVFVMRAVLGRSGAESTELLQQATGDPWTETHVGGAYRAALCSLASSLVHSTAH